MEKGVDPTAIHAYNDLVGETKYLTRTSQCPVGPLNIAIIAVIALPTRSNYISDYKAFLKLRNSVKSLYKCRIEAFEFDPGVLACELPDYPRLQICRSWYSRLLPRFLSMLKGIS
jgi:hypothetical protein